MPSKTLTALYGTDYNDGADTMLLLLYIVDRCNYSCSYCFNKKPRTGDELDADDIFRFIDYVHEQTRKKLRISLIGGEVTLHSRLEELCVGLSSRSFVLDVGIYTNLHKPIDWYVSLVERSGAKVEVNCTWHSVKQDPSNQAFIDKMLLLSDDVFKNFYVTVMFEPDAVKHSDAAYQALRSRWPDAHNIECSLCMQQYSNEPYAYKPEDLKLYYERCKDAYSNRREFYAEYSDGSKDKLTFNDLQGMKINTFKHWLCNAGIDYLAVDRMGGVSKCTHFKPFMNIWQAAYPKLPSKPCICTHSYCPCAWEVYRAKVF